MNKTTVGLSLVLLGFMTGPLLAGEKQSGSELFAYHGCINCHGADAKNPVSKVVPVLAGKPADELFDKSKKILTGETVGKESGIMHSAFYSPSQCDSPPTDEELHKITAWISQR